MERNAMGKEICVTVNGELRVLDVMGERTLLDCLRHELGLTGTKYGCGEGQCGACCVLLDGQAVASCVTPVSAAAGKQVTTIEGLAQDGALHPVQEAFLRHTAFQCGFCTPGMIVATVALLGENPAPTDAEIREGLERHLCRCCTYPRILAAVREAARLKVAPGSWLLARKGDRRHGMEQAAAFSCEEPGARSQERRSRDCTSTRMAA
jgi:aerobic-type carbon monoxide dehydrogenase small subunit (CoxS/CutS family)